MHPAPFPPLHPISRGTQFIEDGKPFYFVGFNAHWLPNLATFEHEWGRTQAAHFMRSAQKLGMRVGRWWAFNKALPANPGEYEEDQFLGLDYTLYLASKFGIRVILALTNLWPQYRGPEHFLYMATGSANGKTVLDYYADRATRELVKRHMDTVVRRVNAYSGVTYRDDPTILGWDVMNEPRCPGCDASEMAIKLDWIAEMAAYLRSIDPNHLITMGSEGYFAPDPATNLHLLNPGAGAQCEGEDWVATVSMKDHDFACIHVYERQVEELPYNHDPKRNDPVWVKCDFECYINWMTRYIEAHEQVAVQINKPLLLEEFGLTWWCVRQSWGGAGRGRMWEYDRRVLLQVVFEMLVDSARSGGPLAGALFWNAAANFTGDWDGYNIYTDRTPKSIPYPAPFAYGPAKRSLIPGPNPQTVPTAAAYPTVAAAAAAAAAAVPAEVPIGSAPSAVTAAAIPAVTAAAAAPTSLQPFAATAGPAADTVTAAVTTVTTATAAATASAAAAAGGSDDGSVRKLLGLKQEEEEGEEEEAGGGLALEGERPAPSGEVQGAEPNTEHGCHQTDHKTEGGHPRAKRNHATERAAAGADSANSGGGAAAGRDRRKRRQRRAGSGGDAVINVSELPDEVHPALLDLLLNGRLGRPVDHLHTDPWDGEAERRAAAAAADAATTASAGGSSGPDANNGGSRDDGDLTELFSAHVPEPLSKAFMAAAAAAAAASARDEGVQPDEELGGVGAPAAEAAEAATEAVGSGPRRRLTEQVLELDGFRRAWQRRVVGGLGRALLSWMPMARNGQPNKLYGYAGNVPWSSIKSYPSGSPELDEGLDIWIIAGQSNAVGENMQGSASACCTSLPGRLLSFNMLQNPEDAWRDAAPCVGCISRGADPWFADSCGPDMAFGRVLLQFGVSGRVGFVATGKGATSLAENWCPGCEQYNEMISAVGRAMAAAGPHAKLRGMIWVQGESDSGNGWNAGQYGSRFGAFLTSVRSDLAQYNRQLPVIMAVMSTRLRDEVFPAIATVRQQQMAFTAPGVFKVDMQNYTFYKQVIRDVYNPSIVFWDKEVHLTQDGQCDMGADMAALYAASGLQ
ncbi:hypothetical protein GPECTOR_4g725 [Gonium pectorale]|uniref:mannan endo-1,4-beta-mannosidase n=1 Tax=Gonium pectorale TaxID=33097 RepID=A0A150GXV2_GONPE|nr:hypothetical protein GPECTOR_4g725 [Gonium pectorale]|eukprot:KXZ54659.1 hypothetical protein GPECTOR_4g725 [Gonium pectorale]